MSDQWPPQPPVRTTQSSVTATAARSYTTFGVTLVVVGSLLAGMIAVVTGAVAFSGTSDALEIVEQATPTPVFEPAFEEGADAFFPLVEQLAIFEEETGQTVSPAAAATGLYGGTAQNTCDPERLIDYLMDNPDKGQAWAQVQGITYEQIPDYIRGLTVRVLAEDAVVLNHGFDTATGSPTEINTTLEAGTAVLVDADGDIRTRCYCGNPITPKPVGHKPPRCVTVPTMIFTSPGGKDTVDGVSVNVVTTGRVTTDLSWTEIAWGAGLDQTGWTPTANLGRQMCTEPLPIGIGPIPTPELIVDPVPEPTLAPTPQPEPIPQPEPTPKPEPTLPPTPTATPGLIQPFQPFCGISKAQIAVGERTEFSGGHVPDSVQVTWSFDHGDGFSEQANPSLAVYATPGNYTITGLADLGGGDVRPVPCGTVTVTGTIDPVTFYCNISSTRILEGGTTTFTGSSDPHNLPITWVFDHGDGYREEANPSISLYPHAGFYDVTAEATYQGQTTVVDCGTVEVMIDTRPITIGQCPAHDFIGLLLSDAQMTADQRGCPHRVYGEAGTSDWRPERLNFVVDGDGLVQDVRYG